MEGHTFKLISHWFFLAGLGQREELLCHAKSKVDITVIYLALCPNGYNVSEHPRDPCPTLSCFAQIAAHGLHIRVVECQQAAQVFKYLHLFQRLAKTAWYALA